MPSSERGTIVVITSSHAIRILSAVAGDANEKLPWKPAWARALPIAFLIAK